LGIVSEYQSNDDDEEEECHHDECWSRLEDELRLRVPAKSAIGTTIYGNVYLAATVLVLPVSSLPESGTDGVLLQCGPQKPSSLQTG